MQPVIDRLLLWRQEMNFQESAGPRARADLIGLANRIDTAVCLLRLCDEFDVSPGACWDAVTDLVSPSHMPEVRIVDDGETDDPAGWRELEFSPGTAVRLPAGSVVIGGLRTVPVTRTISAGF